MEILHNFSLLIWNTINSFTAHLKISVLDLLIILTFLFYAHEGYTLGFSLAAIDLVSFIFSFILALRFYNSIAKLLTIFFTLPIGFANAISFFLIAFFSEVLLSLLSHWLLKLLPSLRQTSPVYRFYKKIDHILGILPGLLSAFIILSFILTVIVALPSSQFIKQQVSGSQLGSKLVANTSFFDSKLNDIFGGALNDTLSFMTIEPKSDELVNLHFTVSNGTIDTQAEQDMFAMVNTQRAQYGLAPLSFDESLALVARAHSQDMFKRGYFSHFTPEGLSPFDRMAKAGITFTSAGENLALAPSTELAMQGLMNSPGHRANILDPGYHKIGIGAVDGGIYGIMFTQDFTN